MQVRILGELFDLLVSKGLDPEFFRKSFGEFKSGDEFEHRLFCHDVGADPGNYLRHVHFFPTIQTDQQRWIALYNVKHDRKRRRSNRYVLYAQHPSYGYLLIDILDDVDPGAHSLWLNRRTRLSGFENTANSFCPHGCKFLDCR